MSDDREPLDELAFLTLLDRCDHCHHTGGSIALADLTRLLHLARKLAAETIRLRNVTRDALQRATLLEQGQQTLFPIAATNTPQ